MGIMGVGLGARAWTMAAEGMVGEMEKSAEVVCGRRILGLSLERCLLGCSQPWTRGLNFEGLGQGGVCHTGLCCMKTTATGEVSVFI